MESKSGKILAIATDKRYSPSHITKDDIPKLQPKFTEYLYEPGSVLKPITLAIAFELGIVNPNTLINTHNGILPLTRRYRIRDDEPFKNLTATDIIVHSSNIGITEIVWRMSAKDFHDGLKRFNLGEPSGIDLPRDLRGRVKSEKLLRNRVDKANQSYGYGMQLTFMQLLRAYSTFNNGGVEVTPSIVDYFENLQGEKFYLKNSRQKRRVISESSALKIKKILKAVVERGTGKAGQYEGLELGGKTGTAHIYDFGAKRYVERYNSSFFGFANDGKGGAYTIGVLAIEPTTENKYYFASKSAVPTFHDIVDDLVKLDYLKPNLSIHRQKELKKEQKRNQELLKIRHQERTKKVKELLRRQRELAKRKKNRLKRKKRVRINRVKKRKNKTSTRTIYQKTRPKRPKPIKRVYPKHTQKPKRPKPIPKPAPKPTQIIKPKPIKKPIPVRVPQDVDLF
jgi:cell division protein FtsI (penicillin-binding protein 3)